ncbi:MAG: HD domain-containing protein [Clostridia bacterium]|nr:HD domain-containing protein [Clostridia bacterium]
MERIVDKYMDYIGLSTFFPVVQKYLSASSLRRLKYIGYFCGMDYASKDIYNFKEKITRFDHSMTVALLTYKLTNSKKKALAGLFHDIATPCFSHAIDYMNGDYANQESTEELTGTIILSDKVIIKCLRDDGIDPEDIINYKQYTVVDNDRPKLCADRLDGIILTGIGWTKNLSYHDIVEIIDDVRIYQNEFGEDEIGFASERVARKVLAISNQIDEYCHQDDDNFMMNLLGTIAKKGIEKGLFRYEDLFTLAEKDILSLLDRSEDNEIKSLMYTFRNVQKHEIVPVELQGIKRRILNPLVKGERLIKS